jgi:hypothetical protein
MVENGIFMGKKRSKKGVFTDESGLGSWSNDAKTGEFLVVQASKIVAAAGQK